MWNGGIDKKAKERRLLLLLHSYRHDLCHWLSCTCRGSFGRLNNVYSSTRSFMSVRKLHHWSLSNDHLPWPVSSAEPPGVPLLPRGWGVPAGWVRFPQSGWGSLQGGWGFTQMHGCCKLCAFVINRRIDIDALGCMTATRRRPPCLRRWYFWLDCLSLRGSDFPSLPAVVLDEPSQAKRCTHFYGTLVGKAINFDDYSIAMQCKSSKILSQNYSSKKCLFTAEITVVRSSFSCRTWIVGLNVKTRALQRLCVGLRHDTYWEIELQKDKRVRQNEI